MRIFMNKVITIILLSSSINCFSQTTSRKSPSFNDKIDGFYVLCNFYDASDDLIDTQNFANALNWELERRNVDMEWEVISQAKRDLDETLIERINSTKLTALMIVVQSNFTYNSDKHSVLSEGGTYKVQIFIPKTKDAIWETYINRQNTFGSNFIKIKRELAPIAKKIVKRLSRDGII